MIVPLVAVLQACCPQVLDPHILVALQGEEHIVLAGVQIMLRQLVHVITMGQAQAMDRELLIHSFLGNK